MNGLISVLKTSVLTMSSEELREALETCRSEINLRQSRAAVTNKRSMKAGDQVSFYNSRKQETVVGEITKVKTKKAIVRVGNVNWDVPLSMLSAA
jgi:predicted RNA-binding protein with PUA-like domain